MRVGIPRALNFLEHYPLWRTFLEALDAELVVSPPTNRDIVTAGARLVADVTCLPVKIFAGHLAWLRDHGSVDTVFVPAIWSLERDAFHCAKFKGLPDILRATVPNCPPLLDIQIDPQKRKLTEEDAFRRLGRQLTWNPVRIRRAWASAQAAQRRYHELLVQERLTYPEGLERLYGAEWRAPARAAGPTRLTIGLAGHPYCLYDDYANHNLIQRLGELGAELVTSEMVSPADAERGVARTTGQTLWFFERWISGAIGHFLAQPDIDGVIAVMSFGCGPDSAMFETATRRAHTLGRPLMSLVLDEHGSATGMMTRLEAFVDMLQRPPVAPRAARPATLPSPKACPALVQPRPVLGIPTMGTSIIPVRSLFRGIGAQLQLGPPASKRTVMLGAQSAPEFICTPYKQILGNMIEMLEAGANTLLYVDGIDLCRNSSYHLLINDALHDRGYTFNFLTFGQIFQGGLFALPEFLRRFSPELTWQTVLREIDLALEKLRVVDSLERLVQRTRAREIDIGQVDKLWTEALARVDSALDRPALRRTALDLQTKMEHIPLRPGYEPVRIVLTGEIFAVLDPFYNLDVERELGRLGVEVHRPLMLSNWVRGNMLLGALGFPIHRDTERAAKPYLRWNVSGDGWQTLAETVIYAQRGFDGAVELLPFTCEPEITALNILPRVSQDYNFPVLTFIFDEQSGSAGIRTRLEAFVDLLRRRRALRGTVPARAPRPRAATRPVRRAGPEVCRACPVLAGCQVRLKGAPFSDCAGSGGG